MLFSKNTHLPKYDKIVHPVLLNLPFWISAAVVALVAVMYAKVFAACENWALENPNQTAILIAAPVGIIVSFLLSHFLSKEAMGSGIPQIIAAVEIKEDEHPILKKLLSFRMILIKMLGSCLCVFGGGSTGREGPTLQVSAAIFYQLSRLWPKKLPKPPQNLMILAGGSAGLAAAFNTPLGGVVFAIEELAKVHILHVRTSIFQAVIISGVISQILVGNYLYLGRSTLDSHAPLLIYQTLFLALVIGVIGAFFAESLLRIGRWRKSQTFTTQLIMTVLCAVGFAVLYWICGPSTLGGGKGFMTELLKNPESQSSVLIPISRYFGNFLTYIAGVIGGVFAPALASGASIAHYISSELGFEAPRVMILVGMVAFLTGVTRTPFTSFVLVLEMSDSHEVIIYLMLSSLVASLVSNVVSTKSFYEQAAHDILHAAAPASDEAKLNAHAEHVLP
jgi:H+/Cl- antiporter ClcA